MDFKLFLGFLSCCVCMIKGYYNTKNGLPVVSSRFGDIIGFMDSVKFGDQNFKVAKFLGIPYAEPPTGNLRFKKPVMKEQLWHIPFKAQDYSMKCPQPQLKFDTMSEDCLYLNIFTPGGITGNNVIRKPVMIWIHGGGFIEGYSDIYEGDVITAIADVIVVTLNYRLGVLGFFSTHDSTAKGNFGLWDQQLAIRWVNENIAAFGGDTSNITIFGESAGSSSVIYQMLYSENKGLFKRAIAESGTIAAWAVGHGNASYEASIEFASLIGCGDLINISACLRSKAEADVISAVVAIESRIVNEVNRSWVPVFDDEFVHAHTANILSELSNPNFKSKYSNFFDIDLMIGANNYDGVVYQDLMMYYINNTTPTSINYNISINQFNHVIVPRALEAWLGKIPTQLALDLTIDEYTTWSDTFSATKRLQDTIDILTDYALNAPTISTARSHMNDNSATYLYQFSVAPPKRLLHLAPVLEGKDVACHTDELPYIFGFTENLRRYWKNFPEGIIGPDDYQLSREMIAMWTNFAKSGNPNMPLQLSKVNSVSWSEFDIFGGKFLHIVPKLFEVKKHLKAEQDDFWDYLLPEVDLT